MKYTYALLLLVGSFNSGHAQTKIDLPIGIIKSEGKDAIHSGPNMITRNVIQDKKGNLWFAAFDGVFRYDGKSFSNIIRQVSSARFFSVLEDRKGNLWFGSIGSGVYCYDGKSFKNYTTKDGLVNDEVSCIYEDKAGNIWLGVNGGASRYDGKSFQNYMMKEASMGEENTGKTVPNFQRPPNEITSITEDKTGKLWFGTRGNTFLYDATKKTFTVVTRGPGVPFMNVRCILEDRKGNTWLGGSEGLWRYDGKLFFKVAQNFVGYIHEDKKGNIWTSSEGPNGNWVLSRYDEKSLTNAIPTVTEIKPNVGMLFGILEDDKGNIWFGAGGAYRYDGTTITDFKAKAVQK